MLELFDLRCSLRFLTSFGTLEALASGWGGPECSRCSAFQQKKTMRINICVPGGLENKFK